GRQLQVFAGIGQLEGVAQGFWVSGKGPRRAAPNVAGELVQQHDARQGAPQLAFPLAQPACHGLFDPGLEAGAYFLVELRVLLEPDMARFQVARIVRRQEPKIEHVLPWRAGHCGAPQASQVTLTFLACAFRSMSRSGNARWRRPT